MAKKRKGMIGKILTYAGLFLGGVLFADKIRPILGGLPVIGGFFIGSAEEAEE